MTAPLTPPDCDLRDFAYMPLDTARLLDSDLFALATGDEFKAAIALWCKAWAQVPCASLPNDDRVLAHLSGAGAKWKKIKEMALRGFVLCDDGRYYHPVIAEKAAEAWAKKQSYRDRSRKGNAKRWGSQEDKQKQSLSDPLGMPKGILERPKEEEEGKKEEEKTPPTPQGGGQDYAFSGKVARLNRRDYDDFRARFHAIPDFDAALAACDGWLSDQSEAKQRKWFGSLAPWLEKRHQEAMQRAKPAEVSFTGFA